MDPKPKSNPLAERVDDRTLLGCRPSVRAYAILDELGFVRREAQAEAELAYHDWRSRPCGEKFSVYLAAQDQLASWSGQLLSGSAAA